jgi:putative transposase
LTYHVVFCPKYRRPVLTGPVVRALIEALAAERGWTVVELAVQPDHVRLFLRCLPEDAPHRAVRAVKGRTSRVLRQEFPALRRRLPSLWTRSYFCRTAGNVSAAAVRRYVAAQRGV